MFISKKAHKAALAALKREFCDDLRKFRESYLRHLCVGKWRFEHINGYYIGPDIYEGEYAISLNCGNCGQTKAIIVKKGVKLSDIDMEIICPMCGIKPQKKV